MISLAALLTLALSNLCLACSANSNLEANNICSRCASPSRDNCSFYRACLEARFHCGPEGYPLAFGEKICTAFSEKRVLLSPKGQEWMLDTMQCLQRALVPEAEGAHGAPKTCAELTAHAYSTHTGCYVKNGFCLLPPEDWVAVVGILGVKTLVGSWNALKQEIQTAQECGQLYLLLQLGDDGVLLQNVLNTRIYT